jgi:uncharacterized surface protein with fasciclin (FAS1) repeats
MSNITQVVRTDKSMTILKQAVIASDMDQVLSSTGPYTLFAPSDLAFGKLEIGTFEDLLKPDNKIRLTEFLNTHVISGKINFKNLKDGDKLKTLNGKELSVQIKDSKVSIDGANILAHDVKTSNGVIHSLDTVLSN